MHQRKLNAVNTEKLKDAQVHPEKHRQLVVRIWGWSAYFVELDKKSMCAHCGRCYRKCLHPECQPFGRCIHACPNGCLTVAGEEVDSDELADSQLHRSYTGVDNGWILENIEWLKKSGKEYVLRVPLIPGITDTEENLRAVSEIAGDSRTELLPYNEFAGAKYSMMGMEYSLKTGKKCTGDATRFFRSAVMRA